MKTNNIHSLPLKLIGSCLMILLLITGACKKEIKPNEETTSKSEITIDEARHFFETNVLRSSPLTSAAKKLVTNGKRLSAREIASNSKINDLLYKHPVWEKARPRTVDDGTAIEIPISFDYKSYVRTDANAGINFESLNYLLITKTSNGDFTAEWVTLYPDKSWIDGYRDVYRGGISVADWDGNVKKRFLFKNAGETSVMKTMSNGSKSNRLNQTGPPPPIDPPVDGYPDINGDCWENIREVPDEVGLGVTLYRKKVPCVTLPPVINEIEPGQQPLPGSPGGTPGGGGGGSYVPPGCNPDPNYKVPSSPPPAGKSWALPCPPPIVKEPLEQKREVKNEVEHPCINEAVETARNAKNTIREMLNDTFKGNDYEDIDITFIDVTTLPDDISGTCRQINSKTFEVELNKNTLPGRSKEYIVSTVYHEVLHAYIDTKYPKGLDGIIAIGDGHSKMADDYIALLTGSLTVAFPSLGLKDAWGLSWGGLQFTSFYKTKLSDSERTEIEDINEQHKKSTPSSKRRGVFCK